MFSELIEISEGKVRLLIYNPEKYKRPDGVYEPAWSPVFYNPGMIVNRDFSVLVASGLNLRDAVVLDALSGTGVRALRYCSEVSGASRCIANDIDSRAYDLIVRNIALNKLEYKVQAVNEDANVLMYSLKKSGVRLDLIDIDPYGSPAPYLRAAIWVIRNGGYLGVTATDLASLSGAKPWAGSRRYWCSLSPTDVQGPVALRVLVGYIARLAAETDRYIEPLTYLIGKHFIRIFLAVKKSATAADAMLFKSTGYLKYCPVCGFRNFSNEIEERVCTKCGGKLNYVGPLWVNHLIKHELVTRIRDSLPTFTYLSSIGMLSKLLEQHMMEVEDAVLVPYNVVYMSSRIKVNTPRIDSLVECLTGLGYRALRYYGMGTVIGTNAPYEDLVSCLKRSALASTKTVLQ